MVLEKQLDARQPAHAKEFSSLVQALQRPTRACCASLWSRASHAAAASQRPAARCVRSDGTEPKRSSTGCSLPSSAVSGRSVCPEPGAAGRAGQPSLRTSCKPCATRPKSVASRCSACLALETCWKNHGFRQIATAAHLRPLPLSRPAPVVGQPDPMAHLVSWPSPWPRPGQTVESGSFSTTGQPAATVAAA